MAAPKKKAAPRKKAAAKKRSGKVTGVQMLARPGCAVCGNPITALVSWDRDDDPVQPRCGDHIPN